MKTKPFKFEEDERVLWNGHPAIIEGFWTHPKWGNMYSVRDQDTGFDDCVLESRIEKLPEAE